MGRGEVILLDTHIWIWWIDGSAQLPADYLAFLRTNASQGLAIAAISCWEVCKLVERGRLSFSVPLETWLAGAVAPPLTILPLTPDVAVEPTRLPGTFHKDPADQLIVATARVFDLPLMTLDALIQAYPHVRPVP